VLRRAHERGWLAALLALVVGAVVAVVVAVGAVGSGWFRPVPGGVVGLASGLVVMVWLVVTQRRGAAGDVAATAGSEPAPTPPA
jgi:hypothetical protein